MSTEGINGNLSAFLQRFDTDRNGEISDKEAQQIKAEISSGKADPKTAKAAMDSGLITLEWLKANAAESFVQKVLNSDTSESSNQRDVTGYATGETNQAVSQSMNDFSITPSSASEGVSSASAAEGAEKTPLERAYENPAVLYAFDKLPQMDANGNIMKDENGNVLIDENSTGDGKLSDEGDIKEQSRFKEYIRTLNNLGEDDEITQEHIDKAVNQLTKDMMTDMTNKSSNDLKDAIEKASQENAEALNGIADQVKALADMAAAQAAKLEAANKPSNVSIPDMPKIQGAPASDKINTSYENLNSILKPDPENDAVLASSEKLKQLKTDMETNKGAMETAKTAYDTAVKNKANDEQKNAVTEKQGEIDTVQGQIDAKQGEIDEKKGAIADKKVEIEQRKDAVSQAKGRVNTAIDAVDAANAALSAAVGMDDDDEGKNDAVSAARQALQQASAELKEARDAQKKAEEDLKKSESDKQKLEEELEGLETKDEDSLENLKTKKTELEAELREIENGIIGDDPEILTLQKTYDDAKGAYEKSETDYKTEYEKQQQKLEDENRQQRESERASLNSDYNTQYMSDYNKYLQDNVYTHIN